MSRVRFEPLPAEITPGELAAIASANADGWIEPPLYNCLEPESPRSWRSVHLRYLERRGLIGHHRYRLDNMPCVQLNAAGLALRPPVTRASYIFASSEPDFINAPCDRRFMVLS